MSSAQAASSRELLARLTERTLAYDFTIWFWGDAIAVDGLLEAAELLGDARPREHVRAFFKRWGRRPLSWVDHLTPGAALLRLGESEPTFMDSALGLAEFLLDAPRSIEGAPMYRPDLPPYRHAVWVDTLYHEPPFFALLAARTGEDRFVDAALDIWKSHVSALSTPGRPFLAHAYDSGARLLRGYGWGRGNGWALLGIADTLELLPENHISRPEALVGFRTLAREVLALQDASGFWRTLLHDREAYLEASTAAFFGAAFTKGVRLGLLGGEYAEAAERAWSATVSRVDAGGSFFGVSACTYAATAPTDDPSMYRTLPTEVNVWGQGCALRFAAERLRSEAAS